jgi:hypothetical protein
MIPPQSGDAAPAAGAAAMEGEGAYNRHARMQAAAGLGALPLLQQAAEAIDLGPDDRPVCIADYGSSQGRNSLAPLGAAIAVLRARIGPARPICVTHTDLPGNDFSALFETLQSDPASYLRDDPNVFAAAVGRSFYEATLPPGQVALGWSAMAAQWLSRLPAPVPGHFCCLLGAAPERRIFAAQAATDWRTFLSLRGRELRPGGRLVVVQPVIGETGLQGMERLFQATDDALDELRATSFISGREQARMVLADWVRTREELLAPFAGSGSFAGLTVAACEVLQRPDPIWAAYQQHGDPALLGAQRARFIRATFAPTLAGGLDQDRPPRDRQHFADALERVLARRAAAEPTAIAQTVSVMVVARGAG